MKKGITTSIFRESTRSLYHYSAHVCPFYGHGPHLPSRHVNTYPFPRQSHYCAVFLHVTFHIVSFPNRKQENQLNVFIVSHHFVVDLSGLNRVT
jgi:hypothetical protein